MESDGKDDQGDPVRFDSAGNVQVYIHLENTDDHSLQQLRDLGATIEVVNSDWDVVQAWVPISALDELAALDAVQEITAPDYAVTKAGSVITEGDAIHRSDLVRAFSGLTGTGVKVGVISDGVAARNSSRSTGDLPSSLEINEDLGGGGNDGDEGTALLEIVHDLAPDARLAFSGAYTSLDMVTAILWLANNAFDGEGADIIVDDLGFYGEPHFEDGPVALAAADAVEGGAVFVSAAGNFARRHYEGEFSGEFSQEDGNFHDFDASSATDTALRIYLSFGTSVILQWNDQFGASNNDYDLFVCPPGLRPVKFNLQNGKCAGSTGVQNGDDDPYERINLFIYDHLGYAADVYVRKFSGDGRRLELFVPGGSVRQHAVPGGGIIGHPAVDDVIAVGAIPASDPGNDDPEGFSDRGPSEIYFPREETRSKPDVMGIDGVSVTGAGNFPSTFYGTSAAAPHVAGIAALVLQAQRLADPTMPKKEVADAVAQVLKDTAIDLGPAGHDNTFEYGRADALADADSLGGITATFTVDSTGDGADSDTADGTCDNGSGACTLRAAIQQANAGDWGVIAFGISGGPFTIQPGSALPAVTKHVFIDGYSQPGASAWNVLIELDGANAGTDTDGLKLTGEGTNVRGAGDQSFHGKRYRTGRLGTPSDRGKSDRHQYRWGH